MCVFVLLRSQIHSTVRVKERALATYRNESCPFSDPFRLPMIHAMISSTERNGEKVISYSRCVSLAGLVQHIFKESRQSYADERHGVIRLLLFHNFFSLTD